MVIEVELLRPEKWLRKTQGKDGDLVLDMKCENRTLGLAHKRDSFHKNHQLSLPCANVQEGCFV